MTDDVEQKGLAVGQGALNELDSFAARLAAWNCQSHGADGGLGAGKHETASPRSATELANDWMKRATTRSAGLARSIRALEQDLARQREDMAEAQMQERRLAVAAVAAVMRRLGITLEDLEDLSLGTALGGPNDQLQTVAPVQARYVGPKGQVWLGHGRRPNWLKQFLAAGGQLDDLHYSEARDAEIKKIQA